MCEKNVMDCIFKWHWISPYLGIQYNVNEGSIYELSQLLLDWMVDNKGLQLTFVRLCHWCLHCEICSFTSSCRELFVRVFYSSSVTLFSYCYDCSLTQHYWTLLLPSLRQNTCCNVWMKTVWALLQLSLTITKRVVSFNLCVLNRWGDSVVYLNCIVSSTVCIFCLSSASGFSQLLNVY